jgi:hypothetical protein
VCFSFLCGKARAIYMAPFGALLQAPIKITYKNRLSQEYNELDACLNILSSFQASFPKLETEHGQQYVSSLTIDVQA